MTFGHPPGGIRSRKRKRKEGREGKYVFPVLCASAFSDS